MPVLVQYALYLYVYDSGVSAVFMGIGFTLKLIPQGRTVGSTGPSLHTLEWHLALKKKFTFLEL